MVKLAGYERGCRGWGIRNHVLVFPMHAAVCTVTEAIASTTDTKFVRHDWHGDWESSDGGRVRDSFVGFVANPNVAAALVVGVTPNDAWLAEELQAKEMPVEFVALSQFKGTAGTVSAGADRVRSLQDSVRSATRVPMPVAALTMGLECGGSDGFSGISANPALGVASDALVAAGGGTILGETPELIGAEQALAARAVSQSVAAEVLSLIEGEEQAIRDMGFDPRGSEPSPGNMAGGLTTIEEKALGAARKSGSATVHGVVGYARPASSRGLVIMDTPGHDVEQLVGMVAGGAQLVAFTTGRGTPTGTPIAPCLRITSNTEVFASSPGEFDVDAGPIIAGNESVAEVGARILAAVFAVANGQPTASELRGNRDFAVSRRLEHVLQMKQKE